MELHPLAQQFAEVAHADRRAALLAEVGRQVGESETPAELSALCEIELASAT